MFDRAGLDGVELDERGPGGVDYQVASTDFVASGAYCDGFDVPDEIDLPEIPDDATDDEIDTIVDAAEAECRSGYTAAENECVEFEADVEAGIAQGHRGQHVRRRQRG